MDRINPSDVGPQGPTPATTVGEEAPLNRGSDDTGEGRGEQPQRPSRRAAGRTTHPPSLVPCGPSPWSEPVDGAALLDELTRTFKRHLALPDSAAEAMALWVVFTHALDAAQVSPRLALLSPAPRCGKTTALSVLARLVARPLPVSNATPAVAFRALDKERPTLLMDEADTFLDNRGEFKSILNSGHTRSTAYVLRCEGDQFEPRRFSTWGAIAVAKIGKLYPALADRSIVIQMRRRRPEDKVERFRPDRSEHLTTLASKVARWVKDDLAVLRGADPLMPDGLNDRAADNWRALVAIADRAGGRWPEASRRAALVLSSEVEEPCFGVMLLADIRAIFDQGTSDRMASKVLCRKLGQMEDRPWADIDGGREIEARKLARLLAPFGVKPQSVRIGDRTPKGYQLADFEDAFARYLAD